MTLKFAENKAWAVAITTQERECFPPSTSNVHNRTEEGFLVLEIFYQDLFFPPGKKKLN